MTRLKEREVLMRRYLVVGAIRGVLMYGSLILLGYVLATLALPYLP